MDIVSEYERLWRTGSTAPDVLGFIAGNLDAAPEQLLSVLHVDQKHRWRTEDPITVEEYLRRLTGLPEGVDWVLQLAVGEFEARQDTDRPLSAAEVSSRFPNLSETLQERAATAAAADHDQRHAVTYITSRPSVSIRKAGIASTGCWAKAASVGCTWATTKNCGGRWRSKFPRRNGSRSPKTQRAYLAEARTVASLDHPHIVPVYDMGRTDDGSVYVVSRFIDGSTLEDRIKGGDLSDRETAELIATVATALHFAHQRRLIHRDVKPANILIEDSTNTHSSPTSDWLFVKKTICSRMRWRDTGVHESRAGPR
jgi:serine/threonine protein kinase